MPRSLTFPDGKKFAFTVVDDTDVATVENVRPVYTLLRDLGMRTTKTVWPLAYDGRTSKFIWSQTLEDPEYLAFVLELKEWGFEITWHSATMESSARPRILEGLERFHELIGHFPRIHVSHAENRENPYWGVARVDLRVVRWLMGRSQHPPGYFVGHEEDSEYWWGDRCQEHIDYCRNLTFDTVNLATVNPTTPYRDPNRPLVRRWFSSSDADDVEAFLRLLSRANQERLEREGGFCIVATHFGKGFAPGGRLDPRVRSALAELARREGWFPTAGELLDWLSAQRGSDALQPGEWRRMQLRFALDGIRRSLRRWAARRRS